MLRRVVPAVVAGAALAGAAWVLGLGAPAVSDAQTPLPVVRLPDFDPADAKSEGTAVQFTVFLDRVHTTDVVVTYSTSDLTTEGAATAGSDYTPKNEATVTIAANHTHDIITIPTFDDDLDELDLEGFTLTLEGATGATVSTSQYSTVGYIKDNDDPPVLSIYGVSGNEGDTGQIHSPVVGSQR